MRQPRVVGRDVVMMHGVRYIYSVFDFWFSFSRKDTVRKGHSKKETDVVDLQAAHLGKTVVMK